MNVLITGATGLLGNALAKKLAQRGHRVRALVRDPARAGRVLPAELELVAGDVTEPQRAGGLAAALRNIDWVFHCAGMPEQWRRDESIFDRLNRGGTANMVAASLDAGVKRFVHTSTMDVFEAPRGGTLVETRLDPRPKHSAYERSKQAAEREVEAARAKGLDAVYVNPAAVYGPCPRPLALNGFFIQLLRGKMPMLPPGGMSVVFVEGVADAHIAAAERGRAGERYLVADAHVSMRQLAAEIGRQAGLARLPPQAPEALLRVIAAVSAPLARAFGFRPLVAPGELGFMLWDARVDSHKAQRELGFVPLPLAEGVARTLAFLRERGLVPR